MNFWLTLFVTTSRRVRDVVVMTRLYLTSVGVFIEEIEDIIFPLIDSRIDKIVSIIRCLPHWPINFQGMYSGQLLELLGHDLAGNSRVVVCCIDKHDGAICLAQCNQEALSDFG